MRKQLLAFLLAFLLLLSPTVLAHSGKTDANGGHYDRSTGEYHYHHGYPAHQHYDMDGDGVADCPYDFDDKTDHSSHDGSGESSSQARYGTVDPSLPVIQNDEKKTVDYNLVVAIIVCSIVLISATVISIRVVKNKKEAERQRLEQKREFDAEKARYTKLYSGKTPEELSGAPVDSQLDEHGLPLEIDSKENWGKYTVHISDSGKAFHASNKCRGSRMWHPINVYTALKLNYQPCRICNPEIPDISWVDKCRRIRSIKEQYGIDTEERAVRPRSAADGRIFICERDR